jgi:phosphopantetheine adenylyltransferase
MLAQLYLAASQALQRCQIDLGKCPVTVIIAGWAGYDLAREHIDWLYACCREEDRGLMARFATHSRHRIQYVQLLGATNGANGVQPPSPNTTPGGSYMGPLPPQMSSFAGVAAQGTFDHLHAGHKVLLTCAAILSTQTIYLGVLDDPAAHRLADPHAKYVQPLAERVHRVASFLARVRRRVALHVTPLAQQDSLGPIGTEVAVQALVVSKETEAMCGTVAAWRISHHLQLLSNYVVDVLGEMAVCVHAGDAADKIDWDKVQREKLASRKVRERLALEVSPTSSTMQGPAAKPSTEATSSQTSLPPPFQPIVQPQASSQPQVVQATGFVPSFQRIEQDTMTKDL